MILLEEATREQLIEQIKESYQEVVIVGLVETADGTEQHMGLKGDVYTVVGLLEAGKLAVFGEGGLSEQQY